MSFFLAPDAKSEKLLKKLEKYRESKGGNTILQIIIFIFFAVCVTYSAITIFSRLGITATLNMGVQVPLAVFIGVVLSVVLAIISLHRTFALGRLIRQLESELERVKKSAAAQISSMEDERSKSRGAAEKELPERPTVLREESAAEVPPQAEGSEPAESAAVESAAP